MIGIIGAIGVIDSCGGVKTLLPPLSLLSPLLTSRSQLRQKIGILSRWLQGKQGAERAAYLAYVSNSATEV